MALPSPVISVGELAVRLANVRVLDAHAGTGARRAYDEAHLAGAVFSDLERDLARLPHNAAEGGRHPLPPIDEFAATLGVWGIGPETPVVVYDRSSGLHAASRAWWMLKAVGHREVSVLDGGWDAARAAGLPIERGVPQITRLYPYPVSDWVLPRATFADVDRVRARDDHRVVDVRSRERFEGISEPIDPIAGHIPGAISLPCTDNLNASGRFQPAEELRAVFAKAFGPVPPERVIVHCGSGVTACHTLLALERAGLSGASLYVGSWSEWCRRGLPRVPE